MPSDTETYETSAIEGALAGAFGAKPEVMCACTGGGWRRTCDTAKIDSVSRAGPPSCAAECKHSLILRLKARPLHSWYRSEVRWCACADPDLRG